MFQEDLIFDLGMHNGADAELYIKKGFRVVGVEANPRLADVARAKFAAEIAEERVAVENVGISNVEDVLDFYINEEEARSGAHSRNILEHGKIICYTTVEVPCKRLDHFIGEYGMPYYLKIDVEGLDATVVRELTRWVIRPLYVSLEDGGIDTLVALYETGVRQFKFINQLAIRDYFRSRYPLWRVGLSKTDSASVRQGRSAGSCQGNGYLPIWPSSSMARGSDRPATLRLTAGGTFMVGMIARVERLAGAAGAQRCNA